MLRINFFLEENIPVNCYHLQQSKKDKEIAWNSSWALVNLVSAQWFIQVAKNKQLLKTDDYLKKQNKTTTKALERETTALHRNMHCASFINWYASKILSTIGFKDCSDQLRAAREV